MLEVCKRLRTWAMGAAAFGVYVVFSPGVAAWLLIHLIPAVFAHVLSEPFLLPCRSVVEGSTRTVSTMQVGRQSALVEMAVCRLPTACCVRFGRDPQTLPAGRSALPNCHLISAVFLSAGQDGVACGAEGCRSVHPCIHPLRACRHPHPHHLPCLGLRGGWAGVWLLG